MKTLTEQLTLYAGYHRDRRNIASHFIGIPMIVFALAILLSRPSLDLGGWHLTPACLLVALSLFYYFRLDRRFGLVMALLFAIALWQADAIARQSLPIWLGWGIGLFVVGWGFQFIGHLYEGRKPAFLDDLAGLIIGPLFVVAEAGFLLGMRRDLQRAMEEKTVIPSVARDPSLRSG